MSDELNFLDTETVKYRLELRISGDEAEIRLLQSRINEAERLLKDLEVVTQAGAGEFTLQQHGYTFTLKYNPAPRRAL